MNIDDFEHVGARAAAVLAFLAAAALCGIAMLPFSNGKVNGVVAATLFLFAALCAPHVFRKSGAALLLVRVLLGVSRRFVRRERFLILALAYEAEPSARASLMKELTQLQAARGSRQQRAVRVQRAVRWLGRWTLTGFLLACTVSGVLAWTSEADTWALVLLSALLLGQFFGTLLYGAYTLTLIFEEPMATVEDVERIEQQAGDLTFEPWYTFILVLGLVGTTAQIVA